MKITLTKPQHQVSSSKKRFRALVSGYCIDYEALSQTEKEER